VSAVSATTSVILDHVTKEFRAKGRSHVTALSDISLDIAKGEFVSLIGPSGCGKSTLLRLLADILKPTQGRIEIAGSSPEALRKQRKIGFVFQEAALMPWRTAVQNVQVPLEVMGSPNMALVEETLAMVGLSDFKNAYPHELSGGMRQRVSIARALVTQPEVMLMDEPFGALDEFTRNYMNGELLKIWERTGSTIIFVTHTIQEAVYMSDRVVLMSPRPGRISEVVNVNLPRPRHESLRTSMDFMQIESMLRERLYALSIGQFDTTAD
jgi:NitT/TauT family transport system ATP-binding protein